MKYWAKIKIEDRMLKDVIVEGEDLRSAVAAVCDAFDLSKPIMLDKHLNETRDFNRTVFYPDDFVDSVSFDSLEIEKISTKKKL
jgi:hypothetical protein